MSGDIDNKKDDEKFEYKKDRFHGSSTLFRLDAQVYGKVQGVSYRAFVAREAQMLGLTGTVSNNSEGLVNVVAEGDRTALQSFVSRLYQGPSGSEVSRVDTKWTQGSGRFNTFDITYGEE